MCTNFPPKLIKLKNATIKNIYNKLICEDAFFPSECGIPTDSSNEVNDWMEKNCFVLLRYFCCWTHTRVCFVLVKYDIKPYDDAEKGEKIVKTKSNVREKR